MFWWKRRHLLQQRIGVAAVRALREEVTLLLRLDWITDCVSFQTMRNWGVRVAFCFDAHFREQGFVTKPGSYVG